MYDPSIIVPLVSTIRLFLSSASVLEVTGSCPKTAIVASTIRNQTTFDAFVAQAGSFASSFPVFWHLSLTGCFFPVCRTFSLPGTQGRRSRPERSPAHLLGSRRRRDERPDSQDSTVHIDLKTAFISCLLASRLKGGQLLRDEEMVGLRNNNLSSRRRRGLYISRRQGGPLHRDTSLSSHRPSARRCREEKQSLSVCKARVTGRLREGRGHEQLVESFGQLWDFEQLLLERLLFLLESQAGLRVQRGEDVPSLSIWRKRKRRRASANAKRANAKSGRQRGETRTVLKDGAVVLPERRPVGDG